MTNLRPINLQSVSLHTSATCWKCSQMCLNSLKLNADIFCSICSEKCKLTKSWPRRQHLIKHKMHLNFDHISYLMLCWFNWKRYPAPPAWVNRPVLLFGRLTIVIQGETTYRVSFVYHPVKFGPKLAWPWKNCIFFRVLHWLHFTALVVNNWKKTAG